MTLQKKIAQWKHEVASWRQDIHKHPELGFEEHRTSDLVAEKLESFGIEVHRGLAKTGVVGTLRAGSSSHAIGLRADMDALPIQEINGYPYCSVHPNVMHACGHDGHTAMLLGAARYLSENRNFDGTVHFIFQPAEEGLGGGEAMVQEGLFEQFPVDSVYGMHNWPGMPVGHFGTRCGPLMASMDTFDITINGKGGHAALPHQGHDPIVVAGQLVGLLQTIVSRNVAPIDPAVVSVTQLEAGSSYNVIPEQVVLRGCIRALSPTTQGQIKKRIENAVVGLCAASAVRGEVVFSNITPLLVNSKSETALAIKAAQSIVGENRVHGDWSPTMGSEDFAFMLEKKAGNYIFVGNDRAEDEAAGDYEWAACMLHNPCYNFNDDAIEWGVAYWCRLTETLLAKD